MIHISILNSDANIYTYVGIDTTFDNYVIDEFILSVNSTDILGLFYYNPLILYCIIYNVRSCMYCATASPKDIYL